MEDVEEQCDKAQEVGAVPVPLRYQNGSILTVEIPDRLSLVLRIGQPATVYLGNSLT